ncbi:MAG: hypothetical protein ACLPSF_03020 [Methylocella sp.]
MPGKIILDEGGMLGRIIIDDHSIVAAFKMRVRFNQRIEVLDPNGSVQARIDIANRTGALAPLWKLTEVTDVARVEMDENAFRIRLSDGSVIRSPNVRDVRQPDLAQVEFWTPATAYDDAEPAPEAIKRYPAIPAAQ